jgi:hypothetical protein
VHRHAQAREAILNSVPDNVLISIYRFQQAHEMWGLLDQRFGTIADIKYNQAENKLRSLVKESNISMKDLLENMHLRRVAATRAPPDT